MQYPNTPFLYNCSPIVSIIAFKFISCKDSCGNEHAELMNSLPIYCTINKGVNKIFYSVFYHMSIKN